MTVATESRVEVAPVAAPRWPGSAEWPRRLARNPTGLSGALIIGALVLVAALAEVVAPYGFADQVAPRLQPPSTAHWLGTDELGRDLLSRLLFGARISLWVGFFSVAVASVLGIPLGVGAGYYGGRLDEIIMRCMDVVFAFPTLVLTIAIVGFLGPSLTHTLLAIGVVSSARVARVARGPVLSLRQQEFVYAARLLGAGDGRILVRHVLPNAMAPLLVEASLLLSTAVLTEAALSFLGLGAQPPVPSWGQMLQAARKFLELAPWTALAPGCAITLAVLGFNQLGDGLRDVLDPRLRSRV
jgi:peptide/nickel transport system permease protein